MVAQLLSLTPEEIIDLHSGKEYFIYDTGFIGGSAHFKIPPPLDSLPRKKTPNLGVPTGAVLMAGGLGSVFKPLAGPTGWYWIGMSPLKQWFPEEDPPLMILPGDKVIYRPISAKKYEELKKKVEGEVSRPRYWSPKNPDDKFTMVNAPSLTLARDSLNGYDLSPHWRKLGGAEKSTILDKAWLKTIG